MAQVIILWRWIVGLARILEAQNNHQITPKKPQKTNPAISPHFHPQKTQHTQKRGTSWGFKTQGTRTSLKEKESGTRLSHREGEGGSCNREKQSQAPRGLETSHPTSLVNRYKSSKEPAKGQNPGSCVVGNGAAGPFLRDATQQERKILRHSLVWLAEHIQVAGLTGQQDHSTAHSRDHRKKMFWDRSTAASPGSRQVQQKGGERQPGLQNSSARAPGDGTGQGREHPNTGQTKQQKHGLVHVGPGTSLTCSGTDHFLTRSPLSV